MATTRKKHPKVRIELPPHVPASPEEIARRKALGKEADRLREAIGPFEMGAAALIRKMRHAGEEVEEDVHG